jgi:hypothetical protein
MKKLHFYRGCNLAPKELCSHARVPNDCVGKELVSHIDDSPLRLKCIRGFELTRCNARVKYVHEVIYGYNPGIQLELEQRILKFKLTKTFINLN